MPKSQLSWIRSQHPPTQWNLRGGRWSSLNKVLKKSKKIYPFQKIKQCYFFLFSIGWHCLAGFLKSIFYDKIFKGATLTLKMTKCIQKNAFGPRNIPEAACDKYISAYFHCIQWETDIGEHQPITEREFVERFQEVLISCFNVNLNKISISRDCPFKLHGFTAGGGGGGETEEFGCGGFLVL
jgi:hypothetical protein